MKTMTREQARLVLAFIEANTDDRCADNMLELLAEIYPPAKPYEEMTPDEEQASLDYQWGKWGEAEAAIQMMAEGRAEASDPDARIALQVYTKAADHNPETDWLERGERLYFNGMTAAEEWIAAQMPNVELAWAETQIGYHVWTDGKEYDDQTWMYEVTGWDGEGICELVDEE